MPAPDAAECRLRLPVSGAHGSNAGTQFAGITLPRISPAGCSFVWTLKYHLPPIRSVTCASVSSFEPLIGNRQLLLRDRHLHARVLADRRRPVEVRGGGRPREVFVSDLPLQHVRGRVGGLDVARRLVAVGGTSLDGWRLADRRTVSAAALPAASTPASNATWKRSEMDSPCTTLYAARAGAPDRMVVDRRRSGSRPNGHAANRRTAPGRPARAAHGASVCIKLEWTFAAR